MMCLSSTPQSSSSLAVDSNRLWKIKRWLFVTIATLLSGSNTVVHGLTVVITGSSQGIGLDAATRLLSQGHEVIHACRSKERSEVAAREAGGGVPMVCDLADFSSVRAFAKELLSNVERRPIDALCLNAGVAPSTKADRPPRLTRDGLEECIGVNHFGHFLLANLLKDELGGGRLIVTASSVHDPESPGGSVGGKGGATLGDLSGFGICLSKNSSTMPDGAVEYDGRKVYNDSKLCNVLFARAATEKWTGVSVRAFNPGFIPSSGLFREPRKDNWLGATLFTFVMGVAGVAVPVATGGQRLAYMATADESEVPSGSYFAAVDVTSRATDVAGGFGPAPVSKEASDDELMERLWERSLEVVGMTVTAE